MPLQTLPTITFGTLHLTADIDISQQENAAHPTLEDVTTTLSQMQRALDLGWTAVPVEILLQQHVGALPARPRYEVLAIKMASPLEIAVAIPQEVLTIPVAVAGLTLAIERVLNCKVRVLSKREGLEADRSESLERRLATEVRIKERLALLKDDQGEPVSPLQVTSAEIHIEGQ